MVVRQDVGAHSVTRDSEPAAVAQPATRHSVPKHRWRSALATAILMLVALALVAAAALVFVFHPRFETVLSGSMRPGIQPGDVVMVRPVPVHTLKVGEVIAYLPPGQSVPVLHRIVSVDSAGIITKGDANNVADPWGRVKPQTDHVYQLIFTIPKLGFVTRDRTAVFTAIGLLIAIAAGALLWPEKRRSTRSKPHADADGPAVMAPPDSRNQADISPSNERGTQ